jgi:hypothetical protein
MNFDHLIDTDFWIAIHHHRHGLSIHPFTAYTEPSRDQIIEACDIDFEPRKGESIEVLYISLDSKDVPNIET